MPFDRVFSRFRGSDRQPRPSSTTSRPAWRRARARPLGLFATALCLRRLRPGRSDIDALAVVVRPPDETMLAAVAPVHVRVDEHLRVGAAGSRSRRSRSPRSRRSRAAGLGVDRPDHRISPGEALHLLPATAHRVLTWAVGARRRADTGRPTRPRVAAGRRPDLARDACSTTCATGPSGSRRCTSSGRSPTRCCHCAARGASRPRRGQLSKRAAADRAAADLVDDAALIRWARDWWYAAGSDYAEPGRHARCATSSTRTSADPRGEPATTPKSVVIQGDWLWTARCEPGRRSTRIEHMFDSAHSARGARSACAWPMACRRDHTRFHWSLRRGPAPDDAANCRSPR